MSFIITIFIIIALFIIRGIESEQKKINNVKSANDLSDRARFENRYVDKGFEDECMELISANADTAINMREIIRRDVGIEPTKKMLVAAMMAEKCKIPTSLVRLGISGSVAWKNKTIERKRILDCARDRFLFLRWYNQRLINNGMKDDELYYLNTPLVTGTCLPDHSNRIRVSDMDDYTLGGVYYWNGIRSNVSIGLGDTL